VVRRARERGYTLIEIMVSLAIFGIIVAVFSILMAEMRSHNKRYPVNFTRHPQISAVLSRLRRDVQDGYGPTPYKTTFLGYEQDEKVLIIESMQPNRSLHTIVWDFREPTTVTRRAYQVGVPTDWVARGLPPDFNLEIEAIKFAGRPYGVRLKATDEEGRVAIDQILQPRAHE
jgi:prepilin-type N-terminal cleavage/methylation domain-containing protein